jgi:hypothetical protein
MLERDVEKRDCPIVGAGGRRRDGHRILRDSSRKADLSWPRAYPRGLSR